MGAALFAPAVVALAGIEVVARAFYAMKDTVTPVVLGAAQLLLMYLLSIWLGRIVFPEQGWLSFGGVALGFSIANWLELIALPCYSAARCTASAHSRCGQAFGAWVWLRWQWRSPCGRPFRISCPTRSNAMAIVVDAVGAVICGRYRLFGRVSFAAGA